MPTTRGGRSPRRRSRRLRRYESFGSPRFTKIENQLKSVENYKVTQLQLIKILREKNILTKQDAATLGVT